MKNFTLLVLCAIALTLLGNAAGAGLIQNADRTGSPISNGTCNNCHNGGNFSPDPLIEILDSGTPVTQYKPGQTYRLRLTINASNNPSGYGFQLVGLNREDMDGGEFGMPESGTRTIDVNGRTYFEQSRRLSENQVSISWTAPPQGSGDIRFYAVGNTVNANGGTSGDVAGTTSFTLAEADNSAVEDTELSKSLRMYPVPVDDYLNIELANPSQEIEEVRIFDVQGRLVSTTTNTARINLSEMSSGAYVVAVTVNDEIAVKRILKL